MTQQRSPVRGGRNRPTLAVTGAAGPIGTAVVSRLMEDANPRRLIAIDTTRCPVPGTSYRRADVRDPILADRLTGVDTLVHLATDRSTATDTSTRRSVNVDGTAAVLAAAETAGVRRVVLVTSAMVYGARPDNSVPLKDAAPIHGVPGPGLIGEWLEMEDLAKQANVDVTVIRPATLVGTVVDALLPGLLQASRLLALRDASCLWQFCHTDDLVEAIVAAAVGWVSRTVTVGCDGWLDHRDVEQIAGMRSIVLPVSVASATAERLHRIGVLRSPASDLEYLAHPWVIGSQRLRAVGWTPKWTNEGALREHLSVIRSNGNRFDRKDATKAAAGATLAVIGTLAIARARSRR